MDGKGNVCEKIILPFHGVVLNLAQNTSSCWGALLSVDTTLP
jgi:hypothetical protein